MSISVGDSIPACTLKTMTAEGPADITTDDIFSGKKVVLFAVPGAFTPGCSMTHLPGYVVNADKIKAAGVDTIVCGHAHDGIHAGGLDLVGVNHVTGQVGHRAAGGESAGYGE